MIKVVFNRKDHDVVKSWLAGFYEGLPSNFKTVLSLKECPPLMLDGGEPVLLLLAEIDRIGHVNVVKAVFQGSHPYRSDCGKCVRCYRYRPEVYYDNENLKDSTGICTRCKELMKGTSDV